MKNFPSINKQIFEEFGIKHAYLFGSQAKGNDIPTSDYDLAVLLERKPSDPLALKETMEISSALQKFFPSKLDVVCLNTAPLLLKYEVVAGGKPIYSSDQAGRINYEVAVIKQYIDEKPLRRLYNRALYKRILQGA